MPKMKMMMILPLLMLLLLLVPTPSFSLFEDQVGFMDWHQRYIGKVKDAVFHTQKAGRKRVVVSTHENVIASLDLRRGDIFWRHVLGPNDVVDNIDIALGKYVITLSSEGSILRAWNLPDGQMVWESLLPGTKSSKSILVVPANLKVDLDSPIFVYSGSCLHAISSLDGELLWKTDFATHGIDVHQLILPSASAAVHAVGVTDLSHFHTYEIGVTSGEILKHTTASFPGGVYGEILPVSNDRFVALDASRSVLVLISIQNGKAHLQQTHVSDLIHESSRETVILPSKLSGIFSVITDTCIAFIKVDDEGKLHVMEKVDKKVVVSDALALSEGEQAFALVQHGDSKIHLSVRLVHDMSSNHLKETVEMDHNRGFVHKIFINSYVRTDRSNGFRALIVMEDHSLLLLQQGEIVWSREDGLASIIDVTTAELPVEKIGVSVAKVEHSLFEWLKGHVLKLKGTLMLATPDELVEIQKIRLRSSEKSKMTRDHNGFRRLLVVLTKAGKLFALHTGDGRVVWSSLLQSLRSSEQCSEPTGLKLHQWQIPHHHALDNNPSVLVVGRCGRSLSSPTAMSIVDAHTGKELQNMVPTHPTVQVIYLPFSDSNEQQLHLLIDADNRAHLYPKTPEAAEIFQRESGNVYWYSVEAEVGILRGYGVKTKCNLDEYCFEARNLWSVVFPSETEKIIATVTRKANEVVHTQAKVIADEDVMYKYVSKNMLFVATVSPKASGPIGSATPDEAVLAVHLVDTVTGRILHRMTHLGSQGPVHAVLSENWVVYHYFNLRAHRYEMSVIEIYDQSRAENKDVLKLIVGKHNLTTPVSSYSRPEVMTKSQSYFFTHSVKAISVTSTAKGITSKHLLIGTVGDQGFVKTREVGEFISGALAGAMTKAVLAPLETIRTRMVVGVGSKKISGSFLEVIEKQGWQGLWAGNAINMIRIVPTQAIELATFECVKRVMTSTKEKWDKEESPSVQLGPVKLSFNLSWVSPIALGGAAAGFVSTLACHPLEVLKDRLTVSPDVYPNLSIAVQKMYANGGIGSFYSGLSPTLIGMLPYSTCYYFMYDTIKNTYCTAQNKKSLSRPEMLLIGALSGLTASTISFPLEVARKRLMVGTLKGKCPPNIAAALSEVVRDEGFIGLYRGWGASCLKVMPSSGITWMFYEAWKDIFLGEDHRQ